MQKNLLQKHFPLLRSLEEVKSIIQQNPVLHNEFQRWKPVQQQEFLDFCTGERGVKILYDSFFKEIFNPEYAPQRLEEVLSAIMNQSVKILKVLPNDSTRISDETSLLITDIIVELEDHSIAMFSPFSFQLSFSCTAGRNHSYFFPIFIPAKESIPILLCI